MCSVQNKRGNKRGELRFLAILGHPTGLARTVAKSKPPPFINVSVRKLPQLMRYRMTAVDTKQTSSDDSFKDPFESIAE